jgi:hypothetical protein
LPRPVAIDTRQPQDGTVKKCLNWPRLGAIIPILTAAGSHPDCRAVLIQIVALYMTFVAVASLRIAGKERLIQVPIVYGDQMPAAEGATDLIVRGEGERTTVLLT